MIAYCFKRAYVRLLLLGILFLLSCDGPTEPQLSSQTVLFTRWADGRAVMFAMREDGSGEIKLTGHPGSDQCARWSPDGRRIAFRSVRDTLIYEGLRERTTNIYLLNSDGSGEVRLTGGPGPVGCPSWSPDGSRIAYTRRGPSGWENIFVIDADGSNDIPLTDDTLGAAFPEWSPDGTTILFLSTRAGGGYPLLHRIDPDGSDRQPFLDVCPLYVSNVRWSPDGSRIAFNCSGTYNTLIHTVRADGSELRTLSTEASEAPYTTDAVPVWSPDGTMLALSRSGDVMYLDLVDGEVTRVTQHALPEWPDDWRASR